MLLDVAPARRTPRLGLVVLRDSCGVGHGWTARLGLGIGAGQPIRPQRLARAACFLGAPAVVVHQRRSRRLGRGSLVACRATELRPRDVKRVGDAVWFDLQLSLPLGLGLTDGSGVVLVEEVRDGGSAAAHNAKHMPIVETFRRPLWVQEGDQLVTVNGIRCSSTEEAVELIKGAADPSSISMKFARKVGGNIKVLFPESETEATVPANAKVADAADAAGHPVQYRCTDGTCGSCWHQDARTDEVYLLCQEDCLVGQKPSQTIYKEDTLFWDEKAYRAQLENNPRFDNTEPLVLRTCPQVYEEWKKSDPAQSAMAEARRTRLFTQESD